MEFADGLREKHGVWDVEQRTADSRQGAASRVWAEMTRAELFEKVVDLINKQFSGILTIKFKKGKIVWARIPRDI